MVAGTSVASTRGTEGNVPAAAHVERGVAQAWQRQGVTWKRCPSPAEITELAPSLCPLHFTTSILAIGARLAQNLVSVPSKTQTPSVFSACVHLKANSYNHTLKSNAVYSAKH